MTEKWGAEKWGVESGDKNTVAVASWQKNRGGEKEETRKWVTGKYWANLKTDDR
ncbi:hypothetical protein [Stieleria maiorica]|uniref:hypothetical protein n=1 Tax=Stieleria maiorica TaxID=2795974 RepID=UPI00142F2E63|nr:hypothetical protein [Stieleria maiorica]